MKKISYILPLSMMGLSVAGQSNRPNIILIVADDLGYADLGCYGSTFYETPNLDALAKDGIRYTNGYAACPVSSPSRASLQTGRYPVRSGITDWIPGRSPNGKGFANDRFLSAPNTNDLPFTETTIAEMLQKSGYHTFFGGKWHLGETAEFWPEKRGYDINKGGCDKGHPKTDKSGNCGGYFSPYCNPRLEDGPPNEYLPDRLVIETNSFIEAQSKEKPFFISLCFYLVHTPLQGKPEYVEYFKKKREQLRIDAKTEFADSLAWMKTATPGKYRERIIQANPVYAAMMKSLDENIGKVIAKLKETGQYENTMIVFTSDNGGLATAEGSPTSNLPLRGGKGWLYEGGIRVPFIVRFPGEKRFGITNDMPVSGIDMLPTFAAACGAKALQPQPDGLNILPFAEKNNYPDRPLFWHYPHYANQGGNPGNAVRWKNFKLINDFETGKYELYDLSSDLGEKNDISAKRPDITLKMKKMLSNWCKSVPAKTMKPNPDWNKQ